MPLYYNTPRTPPQYRVPGTSYNAAGQAYDPRYATDSTASDQQKLAQAQAYRNSIGYAGGQTTKGSQMDIQPVQRPSNTGGQGSGVVSPQPGLRVDNRPPWMRPVGSGADYGYAAQQGPNPISLAEQVAAKQGALPQPQAGITALGQTGLTSQPGRNPMYAGFHGLSAVPAGGTAGGQPGGYTPTLPGTNPGTPGSGATGDHPLYSPGLTQTAENQIAAETAQATNFPYVAKQFDTLGASRGEHTASMAAPIIASLQSQGDAAKANLHLADEVANRRQSLEDWVTRQKGNVGYATLLAQLLEAQQDAGNRLLSGQTNILTGLQEG